MDAAVVAANVKRAREAIANACEGSGRDPANVTLVAVTKGFGPEAVRHVAAAGVTDIGENRVQEALPKMMDVAEIRLTWHMIGHLQTNKVRPVLDHFDMIHSVDSLRLAEAIASRARKPVSVFIEVNVANEPTKSGFTLAELPEASRAIRALPSLDLRGLMTVAPVSRNPEDARPVFQQLRKEAEMLQLTALSMGMSDDFEVAVEEGATHVRLGRAIFGERPGL